MQVYKEGKYINKFILNIRNNEFVSLLSAMGESRCL